MNVALLKQVAFIADNFDYFDAVESAEFSCHVNSNLTFADDVEYALKILNIPFESFESSDSVATTGTNISFGCDVDFGVIHLLTQTLRAIKGPDGFHVYIRYSSDYDDRRRITIDWQISNVATNLSRAILPKEIIALSIEDFLIEDLFTKFPPRDGIDRSIIPDREYHHRSRSDEYYDYDDEIIIVGDPRTDPNENPWIDVFGPGEEAETAYWNTD